MFKTLVFFFVTFLYSNAWSTQAISDAPASSTIEFDRYCSCSRITNNNTKAVMIPHNTVTELNSFYSGLPTNVSRSVGCFFSEGGTPSYTINNINTSNCTAETNVGIVSGMLQNPNNATFDLSDINFCTTCSCEYRKNSGTWNVVNYLDDILHCQQDRIQFRFTCPLGTHYTTVTIGDVSFNVDMNVVFSCF